MKISKVVENPVLQFAGAISYAVLEDGEILALFVNKYDADQFYKTFSSNSQADFELVQVRLEH